MMARARVTAVPGRGLGVMAVQDIKEGDVLLVEMPVLRLTPDIMRPKAHWMGRDPESVRAILRTLTDTAGPALKWTWFEKDLDAIVNTNSFSLFSGGVVHSYLFEHLSRFNHSCDPNAVMWFNGNTDIANVKALRAIKPGTEVVINYGSEGTLEERRAWLQQSFGFQCSCTLCAYQEQVAGQPPSKRWCPPARAVGADEEPMTFGS